MTTITTTIARFVALPIVSAGIIAGAALGMAGTANAAAQQQPGSPGHSYSPNTYAAPAPTPSPGWRNHHGHGHIADLQRQLDRHMGR